MNPEPSPSRCKVAFFLGCFALLTACASGVGDRSPRTGSAIPPDLPPDPVPRDEPRSRYGNGPYYEVLGRTYRVMDTSYGYRERGVASWYGKKFHGRPTSSREPYDMYAMTAAHKSLPLPTYVRVRNLRNNRSVVVRVNDRGPFVDNRLIDLSYSAAVRLDMIRSGTSLVEVTALSFDEPPVTAAREPVSNTVPEPARTTPAADEPTLFVQVGAFGEVENARRRYRLLRDSGVDHVSVHEDLSRTPALYRVRIGPIHDVLQYDSVVAHLRNLGISETHLVSD